MFCLTSGRSRKFSFSNVRVGIGLKTRVGVICSETLMDGCRAKPWGKSNLYKISGKSNSHERGSKRTCDLQEDSQYDLFCCQCLS